MARYAIIRNNLIENLVDWDGGPEWSPPTGAVAAPAPMACSVGWQWNNGSPVDPNPPPSLPDQHNEGWRGLMMRRIAELEGNPGIQHQIEALKLRLQLLGG